MAHGLVPPGKQSSVHGGAHEKLLPCWAEFLRYTVTCCNQAVERLQRREFRTQALEFCYGNLGCNVADEGVLREGTAAESAEGHVEAAAACAVSGADFGRYFFLARMQVHADFQAVTGGKNGAD